MASKSNSDDKTLQQLGALVNASSFKFSQGGTLQDKAEAETEAVSITVKHDKVLKFPLSSQDEDELVKLCEPAPFGKDQETVLDPSYRQALKLDADDFYSSLCLEEQSLLRYVEQALCPSYNDTVIVVKPDNLNVYTKGGFFKSHADTPKATNMIGTLVVVLPNEFEGGDLVVKHPAGNAAVFDWPDKKRVQYAAFYSDCEHEILEVKSGARVSIAYSLYAEPRNEPSALPIHEPITSKFASCIQDAAFMPDGGVLGFHLQYMYPQDAITKQIDPICLKAGDAALFATAKSLNLEAELLCLWDNPKSLYWFLEDYGEDEDSEERQQQLARLDPAIREKQSLSQKFTMDGENFTYGDDLEPDRYAGELQAKNILDKVRWCNERGGTWKGSSYLAYGNQAELKYVYCSAVLCLTIPPATARSAPATLKRKLASAAVQAALAENGGQAKPGAAGQAKKGKARATKAK